MSEWIKNILIIFFILVILWFGIEMLGLGFFKFFEPKRENIRIEIFENTQFYVHGKIQDLSRLYHQYNEADSISREVLESIIRQQFAEFDKENINSLELKSFLTKIRGY